MRRCAPAEIASPQPRDALRPTTSSGSTPVIADQLAALIDQAGRNLDTLELLALRLP